MTARRNIRREHATQRAVLEYLDWCHLPHVRANAGIFRSIDGKRIVQGAPRGTADIITILPGGRFCGIECKRAGETTAPEQDAWIERVEELGGVAIIAYSMDDVRAVVEPLMGRHVNG